MIKLKPCPFCGRSHGLSIKSIHHVLGYITYEQWSVFCDASGDKGGCGASCGYHRTKTEAIEAWNGRAGEGELIRCKDCKHWTQSMGGMKGYGLGKCDFHDVHLVTYNGFCYWAERRSDVKSDKGASR